jgi:hypothetical protein
VRARVRGVSRSGSARKRVTPAFERREEPKTPTKRPRAVSKASNKKFNATPKASDKKESVAKGKTSTIKVARKVAGKVAPGPVNLISSSESKESKESKEDPPTPLYKGGRSPGPSRGYGRPPRRGRGRGYRRATITY